MIDCIFFDVFFSFDLGGMKITFDTLSQLFVVVKVIWVDTVWTVDTTICFGYSH